MTNQTYAAKQETIKETSALEYISSCMAEYNSRLINNIIRLEEITNRARQSHQTETKGDKMAAFPSDGLISDIGTQLSYYSGHISRLEEQIKKLSELI